MGCPKNRFLTKECFCMKDSAFFTKFSREVFDIYTELSVFYV